MSRDNGLLLPIQLTTDERQFLVLGIGVLVLTVMAAQRDAMGFVNSDADERTAQLTAEFVRIAEKVDHIALMRRLS